MAEELRTIITSIDNLSDAVAMSVVNGVAMAPFSGRATNDCPSGINGPTACLSQGWMDEVIIAAYEADPRFFVSEKAGRNWRGALEDYPAILGGPLCEFVPA